MRVYCWAWIRSGAFTRWQNGTTWHLVAKYLNRPIPKGFQTLALNAQLVMGILQGLVERIYGIFRFSKETGDSSLKQQPSNVVSLQKISTSASKSTAESGVKCVAGEGGGALRGNGVMEKAE